MTTTALLESRDAFVYAAATWFLHTLDPSSEAVVTVLNHREPSRKVVVMTHATAPTAVRFHGDELTYAVETSAPLSTDAKPEPFRRLRLSGPRRAIVRLIGEALDAYKAHVFGGAGADPDGEVPYWTWDGDVWCRAKARRRRPLATLFLHPKAAEVVDDVRHFQGEAATTYRRLHVAPTRVYLLHGLPGSGKSSLVHCVASELGLGVAHASFGPGASDAEVRAAFGSLPPRCLLCLEDVDCLFDGRSAGGSGVTFAGLLAALDDDTATEPVVIFLTTNRLLALDPALRRRVDSVVEFGHATRDQARGLFEQHFPGHDFAAFWDAVGGTRFSMSVLQKYLLRARRGGDPLAALDAFHDLVACAMADGREGAAGMYT